LRIELNGVVVEGSVEELQEIGIEFLKKKKGSNVDSVEIVSFETETVDASTKGNPFCKPTVIGRTFGVLVKFKDGSQLMCEKYFPENFLKQQGDRQDQHEYIKNHVKELFV
jgi:hypothetical protein